MLLDKIHDAISIYNHCKGIEIEFNLNTSCLQVPQLLPLPLPPLLPQPLQLLLLPPQLPHPLLPPLLLLPQHLPLPQLPLPQ